MATIDRFFQIQATYRVTCKTKQLASLDSVADLQRLRLERFHSIILWEIIVHTVYSISGRVLSRECFTLCHTVESPNKGHFGTVILSFVRRLSLTGKSTMYWNYGRKYTGT